MRIAIVHDYLNQMGGAEHVLLTLHEIFPEAPIYTSFYRPEDMPSAFRQLDIRTTFLQKLGALTRYPRHQKLLPLYPIAFEQLDLREFDVVISNSSAWCKGVITREDARHICYCLSPMRFGWNTHEYLAGEQVGWLARKLLPPMLTWIRAWDVASSARVDEFIAISRVVADRIRKVYKRDAAIIYPPVDTGEFSHSDETDDYFLVVSRLVPYKRVDLVVDAFNRLGLPLRIIGDGRDRARLKAMAQTNVQFLGFVSDEERRDHFARCRALIFPGEEDFGLVPVETQASGRPVIAYAAGGALDTVVEGETGLFFAEQTVDALCEAVQRFDAMTFDTERISAHAAAFDTQVFKEMIAVLVARTSP
jgi:glycosyltransferase involved in cell wall biosynthesis